MPLAFHARRSALSSLLVGRNALCTGLVFGAFLCAVGGATLVASSEAQTGRALGQVPGRRSELSAVGLVVRPSRGDSRTAFVIRFTSHATLGLERGYRTEYTLSSFEGNRHPTVGCTGSFADAIKRGKPDQVLGFREDPHAYPLDVGGLGVWCPARYAAKVRFVGYPTCHQGQVTDCGPRAADAVSKVVGRVSWHVSRRTTS